jgi:hypothetical protein
MGSQHSNPKWIAFAKKRMALARANNEQPCHMCGRELNYALDGRHRFGPTVDHMEPLAWGGELLPPMEMTRIVHRSCNSRQGARIRNARARLKKPQQGGRGSKPVAPARSLSNTPIATNESPINPNGAGVNLNHDAGGSFVSVGNEDPARGSAPSVLLDPDRPAWWPAHLHHPPANARLPRIETPHHPDAVGTYGPVFIEWARVEMGVTLRWWQQYAACRMLEHDILGRLCWPEVGISTARQNGKSILLRCLAAWRIHMAGLFGEVQTVLHVSNNLGVVNEVATPALIWAQGRGYHVRRTNGEVEIRLPDGSRWVPRSSRSAYGLSCGMALVDECWDLPPLVVDSMITPTLLERSHPQMVLFSTAHPNATSLFPSFRVAGSAADGRLILEWSAHKDADRLDPDTWREASPEWSEQRQRIMARQAVRIAPDDFAAQFLNIWPEVVRDAADPAPFPAWGLLPEVDQSEPPFGALVALDEHFDASGAMVAALHDGQLWVREVEDVRAAVALAQSWTNAEVLVGFSLRHVVATMGLSHAVAFGMKETAFGLPLLLEAVKHGGLAHEHSEVMSRQASGARVKVSDSGVMSLSVKNSEGSVTGLKLIAWMLWAEKGRAQEAPAVW